MICEKCKHEIGPKEQKCRYCGADNPFAIKHVQNMKKFQTDFENTETEVNWAAEKTGGLAKRAAILIALILGCVIASIVSSMNYADSDPEKAVRRDALKNSATYAGEADAYLERGEYIEFVSFLYAHELMNFPPEEFERFDRVRHVAREYYNCITEMEEMILRSTDPEYFDGLDSDISIFCISLEEFYQVLQAQKEGEKDAKYSAYMEDMKTELEAAMKTYFSMDDDALNAFLAMSQAEKGVKLEEVLRHE